MCGAGGCRTVSAQNNVEPKMAKETNLGLWHVAQATPYGFSYCGRAKRSPVAAIEMYEGERRS